MPEHGYGTTTGAVAAYMRLRCQAHPAWKRDIHDYLPLVMARGLLGRLPDALAETDADQYVADAAAVLCWSGWERHAPNNANAQGNLVAVTTTDYVHDGIPTVDLAQTPWDQVTAWAAYAAASLAPRYRASWIVAAQDGDPVAAAALAASQGSPSSQAAP